MVVGGRFAHANKMNLFISLLKDNNPNLFFKTNIDEKLFSGGQWSHFCCRAASPAGWPRGEDDRGGGGVPHPRQGGRPGQHQLRGVCPHGSGTIILNYHPWAKPQPAAV